MKLPKRFFDLKNVFQYEIDMEFIFQYQTPQNRVPIGKINVRIFFFTIDNAFIAPQVCMVIFQCKYVQCTLMIKWTRICLLAHCKSICIIGQFTCACELTELKWMVQRYILV